MLLVFFNYKCQILFFAYASGYDILFPWVMQAEIVHNPNITSRKDKDIREL